jgi:hypothetical protein
VLYPHIYLTCLPVIRCGAREVSQAKRMPRLEESRCPRHSPPFVIIMHACTTSSTKSSGQAYSTESQLQNNNIISRATAATTTLPCSCVKQDLYKLTGDLSSCRGKAAVQFTNLRYCCQRHPIGHRFLIVVFNAPRPAINQHVSVGHSAV